MKTTKKKANSASKLKLPLPAAGNCAAMVTACTQQVSTILANPAIANHPEVKVAANNVLDQTTVLAKTMTDLGDARTVVKTLEGQRGIQASTLQLQHANLEALLNVVSAGNKQAALAWGGKIASRTSFAPSTDAPVNAVAQATTTPGTVLAKCKAERGVVCYLFQMGSENDDPETWPQPVIEGGCKHTVAGLPVGQKVYFRIAIVRRGGLRGEWSSVLEVMVR